MSRRRSLLLLALLLCAQPAAAAVDCTIVSGKTAQSGSVNTLTVAGVAVTGSNTLLLIDTGTGDASPANVSSVTWNGSGVGVTQLSAQTFGAFFKQEVWYLLGPSGTHDVVVTWAASQSAVLVGVKVCSGVNQGTPFGTPALAEGGLGSQLATVNVSSAANEVVVDAVFVPSVGIGGVTMNPGVGQAELYEVQEANSLDGLAGSWETGAATTTMSYTWDATDRAWGTIAVGVKPAAAASSCQSRSLLGVGC